MRVIEYLGTFFQVPEWANFIAADPDGIVVAYENRPYWDYKSLSWYYSGGDFESVGSLAEQMDYMPPVLVI